jgi:hypothetical protein
MGLYVTLTLELEITDAQTFRETAIASYSETNPNATPEELEDFFGTAEEPNCSGCARELFDPGVSPDGCEIQDSSAEEFSL